MKLSRLFFEDAILQGIEEVDTMPALLEAALERLPDEDLSGARRAEALRLLLEREALGSIIVNGAALPHARVPGLERPIIAAAVPVEPLQIVSSIEDEKIEPVHIAFIILVPAGQNTLMLQTLAALSKLLAGESGATLASIKSPGRFIRHIGETGIDVKRLLIAADLMRTPPRIHATTLLGEAVRAMIEARDSSVAVVDEGGALVGEVDAAALLRVGVPSHLALLSDTNMLDSYEAFESYFDQENTLDVSGLVNPKIESVRDNDSVMAVAQKFLKSRHRKLYVLGKDGRLRGEIRLYDMTVRVLGV